MDDCDHSPETTVEIVRLAHECGEEDDKEGNHCSSLPPTSSNNGLNPQLLSVLECVVKITESNRDGDGDGQTTHPIPSRPAFTCNGFNWYKLDSFDIRDISNDSVSTDLEETWNQEDEIDPKSHCGYRRVYDEKSRLRRGGLIITNMTRTEILREKE